MARGGGGGGGDDRGRGHAPRITAVEVFIYRVTDGLPEYLLLQRESGVWQPASGKIEDRETPIQAARREAREETGFTPEKVRPAHWADAFIDPERGRLFLLPVFFAEVPGDREAVLGREHTAHGWLTYEKAMERLAFHGYREALRAVEAARTTPVMPDARVAAPTGGGGGGGRRRRRRGRGRGSGSPGPGGGGNSPSDGS